MNQYRTHTCGQLRAENIGETVKIAGWIHRKRNLGSLCFIDLRDHYGITQCVLDSSSDLFDSIKDIRVESVIGVAGKVIKRESVNPNMPTGDVEIAVESIEVHSTADVLPFQVSVEDDAPEELRLKYRFLDLRKERIHNNILLRSAVISEMRKLMVEQGFTEYQTPILTASSPEGARDFLVPSRLNPGKFYALPQAPQQFKQLLMVSGFDKYFQIAPWFRDEDPRADRSPGEFYQLDLEMSFATQEDVFKVVEHTMGGIFNKFGMDSEVYPSNIEEAIEMRKKVALTGAKLMLIKQKHMGSDKLPIYIENFTTYLKEQGVEIKELTDDIKPIKKMII